MTVALRAEPTATRAAPGIRQFRAATAATERIATTCTKAGKPSANATTRTASATSARGHHMIRTLRRLRQFPRKRRPASPPTATLLTNMAIASDRFAGKPLAQLRKSLVVDRRQLADFE